MTKTIKYFLIGLAFFFIHLNSFGQQSQIDSSIVLYENIKPLIISSDTTSSPFIFDFKLLTNDLRSDNFNDDK